MRLRPGLALQWNGGVQALNLKENHNKQNQVSKKKKGPMLQSKTTILSKMAKLRIIKLKKKTTKKKKKTTTKNVSHFIFMHVADEIVCGCHKLKYIDEILKSISRRYL